MGPKLSKLLQDSLVIGQTRLCGKRVGRALSRGDRPTEPSYSWLPENWIGVQPPGFSLQHGLTPADTIEAGRVSQRGYSPFDIRYNFPRRVKIILIKVLCPRGPKSSHPNRKR